MILLHPNGKEIEWTPPEEITGEIFPADYLTSIDCTFPYAYGYDCPASVVSVDSYDTNGFSEELSNLHKNLDSAVEYILNGEQLSPDFKAKSPRLANLIESISEEAKFEEEGIYRDQYTDLQAFLDYISNVVEQSPTYWTSTEGQDHDTMPGMSSSYHVHWDNEPKTAITFITQLVAEDIKLLQSEGYK